MMSTKQNTALSGAIRTLRTSFVMQILTSGMVFTSFLVEISFRYSIINFLFNVLQILLRDEAFKKHAMTKAMGPIIKRSDDNSGNCMLFLRVEKSEKKSVKEVQRVIIDQVKFVADELRFVADELRFVTDELLL